MPYPNEHAARLKDPKGFDSFGRTKGGTIYGRKKVPSTIAIIWGHPKGGPKKAAIPQALRFPTKNWTAAAAKKWLKDNKIKYISFEPASKGESVEGSLKKIIEKIKGKKRRKKMPSLKKSWVKSEKNSRLSIFEKFFSLRRALERAVKDSFGKSNWIIDYSNKEIVFCPEDNVDNNYFIVGYSISAKGEVTFKGAPKAVQQKISYEKKLSTGDLIDLAEMEARIKRRRENEDSS